MESATHYRNGRKKTKYRKEKIKYTPDQLRMNVRESEALKKFLRKRLHFKESSEELYVSHVTTYCYFHQKQIDDLIEEYKQDKENFDGDDEDELKVYEDVFDYIKHSIDNKQAKSTIQGKEKRIRTFLRDNKITFPKIDIKLKTYDDSEGYYTKQDLPDKKTMKTVISTSNPKYAAIFSWVYTTGSGRSETANLTVTNFITGIKEFCDNKEDPKEIIKELDGNTIQEKIIDGKKVKIPVVPKIKMKRKKTNHPYYTITTPECVQIIIDYIKTDLSILDHYNAYEDDYDERGRLFGIQAGSVGNAFKDTNLKYGWGKRGRYNFFGCHRLRHNHYTQIDNHNLANALEGRVITDKINKTYDHNLDDPDYLREKYKDHMHKFEIFDRYNLQINSEAMEKLENENKELRNKIEEYENTIEELQNANTTIETRMDTLENRLNITANEKTLEQLIDYASNNELVKEHNLMDIVMELYRNKFKDADIVNLNIQSMEELVYLAYNIKINRKNNKKIPKEYENDPFCLDILMPISDRLREQANTFLDEMGYKLSKYQNSELNKIITDYAEKIYDDGKSIEDIEEYVTEQQLKEIITEIALGYKN